MNKLRASAGNGMRAAVLGVTDGLSTNTSLAAGLAAAGTGPGAAAIALAASLAAGSFSMASGEYMSVSGAQAEAQAQDPRKIVAQLEKDLAAEYQKPDKRTGRRLTPHAARARAKQALNSLDPQLRQLLINKSSGEDDDGPASPKVAAVSSLASFALGAALPTLPYVAAATGILSGGLALPLTLAAGGVGMFGAGALTGKFNGKGAWKTGLQQLVIGGLATGLSYAAMTATAAGAGATLAAALPAIAIGGAAATTLYAGYRLLKSRRAARRRRAQAARRAGYHRRRPTRVPQSRSATTCPRSTQSSWPVAPDSPRRSRTGRSS